MVLDTMLAIIKATSNDKIVLVSNYTQVRSRSFDTVVLKAL